MRKADNGEKEKNIMTKIGAIMSLPVDCPTVTDCNAATHANCQYPFISLALGSEYERNGWF